MTKKTFSGDISFNFAKRNGLKSPSQSKFEEHLIIHLTEVKLYLIIRYLMNKIMNCNTNGLIFNQLVMTQLEYTKKNRFKTRIMVPPVLRQGLIKPRVVSPADLLTKESACIQLNTWQHFLGWHPASSKVGFPLLGMYLLLHI